MLCFAQTNLLLELQRAHPGNCFELAMKIRRRHAVKLRQGFNGYGFIKIAPQPPNGTNDGVRRGAFTQKRQEPRCSRAGQQKAVNVANNAGGSQRCKLRRFEQLDEPLKVKEQVFSRLKHKDGFGRQLRVLFLVGLRQVFGQFDQRSAVKRQRNR